MGLKYEVVKRLLRESNRYVRCTMAYPYGLLKSDCIELVDAEGGEFGELDRITLNRLVTDGILNFGSFDGKSIQVYGRNR
jgi:hypothetical protein